LKSKWGQHGSQIGSPTATIEVWKRKYVGGGKSEVFYHSDCKWAEKISPKDLIGLKSKEEAIRSGRGDVVRSASRDQIKHSRQIRHNHG
jgi:hypothetical protein